jgi:phosphoserine phosphatase
MDRLSGKTETAIRGLIARGLRTAIFDLDGTLARTDITDLYFFMRRQVFPKAFLYQAWKSALYAVYGPPFLLIDRLDRPTFQRLFFRWYHRFTVKELRSAAADFFVSRGRHLIRPEYAALLEYMKGAGVRVEIHSTNLAPFVQQFANHFGVPFAATELEGTVSGCQIATRCLRTFKVDALRRFDLSTTAVVADSKSDLPALRVVAFPILVSRQVPRWSEGIDMLVLDHDAEIIRSDQNTGMSFATLST